MVYIEINNGVVTFVHNIPFDKQNGLGKTKEELEETGFLLDSIPDATPQAGQDFIMKFDGTNVFYEYHDAPLTTNEEVESLKAQNAQMLLALVEGGLM
ncbi:hypothetical protein M2M59_04080 [Rummeliibacillus sp. G93]|uniref:hypothetical protein n=1 Tax=Rummeliibacillus sp. G93 TaxID=2939494 RepID=UPI00201C2E16|nr:hypothetical protein [Rummeliibacillus sp. G93]UQW98196.1 hypothetical protein M2M59_04080 [Rummeliibacillus sp. G93]